MAAPKGVSPKERSATARRRERQALELRLQGLNHSQIARQLGCDAESVRRYVKSELQRRGLRIVYTLVPVASPRSVGDCDHDRDLEAVS